MSSQPEVDSQMELYVRLIMYVKERIDNATSPEELTALTELWEAFNEYKNHLLDQTYARIEMATERLKRIDDMSVQFMQLLDEKAAEVVTSSTE